MSSIDSSTGASSSECVQFLNANTRACLSRSPTVDAPYRRDGVYRARIESNLSTHIGTSTGRMTGRRHLLEPLAGKGEYGL